MSEPGGTAESAPAAASAPAQTLPPALSLELGYGLLAATEGAARAELLRGVAGVREWAARDWGLQVPALHITDNLRLPPTGYAYKIRGVDAAGGRCRPGAGCTDTLVGRFRTVIEHHAAELLGRDQVRAMIDELRDTCPTVVAEASAALTVGEIRMVLQGLLRERVSIRDLVTILETLADEADRQRDGDYLVRRVRRALGRQISAQHSDERGVLHVVTLAPELERELLAGDTGAAVRPGAESEFERRWIDELAATLGQTAGQGCRPAVVASEEVRALVKRSTERRMPELVCLATSEVAAAGSVRRLAESNRGRRRIGTGELRHALLHRARFQLSGGTGADAAAVRTRRLHTVASVGAVAECWGSLPVPPWRSPATSMPARRL